MTSLSVAVLEKVNSLSPRLSSPRRRWTSISVALLQSKGQVSDSCSSSFNTLIYLWCSILSVDSIFYGWIKSVLICSVFVSEAGMIKRLLFLSEATMQYMLASGL
ncbi:hypothetical protein F2Q69_00052361 [Brassica cretica]|uniref:Uncharacterized protein n=1 Tax=Brassica cretica TaxID=69181 RepID=A0A8S9MUS1_BRACR|nr:hypothetical protein F2Q69_00052361 [Brassica cretica]